MSHGRFTDLVVAEGNLPQLEGLDELASTLQFITC